MALPDIQGKVAFLSRPEAYAGAPGQVHIRETHMSWVFMTETHAWKLKKPVRSEHFDFSTPEARRKNCEEEVRLNRRLAPGVYLGVVPLTVGKEGHLDLGGSGQPIDWLVHMRRLPPDRMLDQAIANRTWTKDEMRKVGFRLAYFYRRQARPLAMTGEEYRAQLSGDLLSARTELSREEYHLPADLIKSAIAMELIRLGQDADLFDTRARAGKVVEGHGDLRPEHICLEPEPVIIDCLEFNDALRRVDPASELSFLALECERLGAPRAGALILETYSEVTGDRPSQRLLEFYKAYHACIRAKVAIWHLRDPGFGSASKWTDRAIEYLRRAAS
jgi:aminoglycoside phosphotransferase family enzyme